MDKLKKLYIVLCAVSLSCMMSIIAFAESTGTADTQVVTHFTTIANNMTATATALIPIALGVVGITLVVRYGIKVFKSIGSKA